MDILKLIFIFIIIIAVIWAKRPMWMAALLASAGIILIYRLSLPRAAHAIIVGATARETIETLAVFYSITFLQRMMEKRRDLSNAQAAMNGLFNNNRINASVVPFLLGMLPAAGTVLICGPIVRESAKNSDLKTAEKAGITTYFRHISEAFVPTYTSIFIALEITSGRVSPGAFILAMLPMVFALFGIGWLFYLRRIPKDTGMVPDQSRAFYWRLLLKSIWAIALTILLILALGIPVWLAVWISIFINVFVNRFEIRELRPFIRSAFETRLMLSTWMIMIFKELLTETGVILSLPAFFSTLQIPTFLIFTLLFFFGTVVAGIQAIIVLCMPMAMEVIPTGHTGLALFILLMCVSFGATQISPTHICPILCAEDYGVSFGQMVLKLLPMVLTFTLLSLGYYIVLSVFGF